MWTRVVQQRRPSGREQVPLDPGHPPIVVSHLLPRQTARVQPRHRTRRRPSDWRRPWRCVRWLRCWWRRGAGLWVAGKTFVNASRAGRAVILSHKNDPRRVWRKGTGTASLAIRKHEKDGRMSVSCWRGRCTLVRARSWKVVPHIARFSFRVPIYVCYGISTMYLIPRTSSDKIHIYWAASPHERSSDGMRRLAASSTGGLRVAWALTRIDIWHAGGYADAPHPRPRPRPCHARPSRSLGISDAWNAPGSAGLMRSLTLCIAVYKVLFIVAEERKEDPIVLKRA